VLASHYLAIRLPAEITLPHRDYPRPTIFNLSSSYQHGDIPFPGSAVIPNFGSVKGDREASYVPRPRPLFVDKPLPALAKEDPQTYKMFLEGVALLAYDVAWACISQGVSIGDRSSFDDVCNLGRNLYSLLLSQHNSQTSTSSPQANAATNSSPSNGEGSETGKATAVMGRYSHGTSHNFLGSTEGAEFVKTFKLLAPKSLADKLRSKVVSDTAAAEPWEVLDNDTWVIDDEEGALGGQKGWMRVRAR
jgi:Vacuolar sorting 38 and autophagy-related subunit 14